MGLGVKVDLSGMAALLPKLGQAHQDASLAMAKGAGDGATELVPVDTGDLRDSKVVEKRKDGSAVVKFTSDHAAVVHNVNRRYHKGQWQFLRQPLMQAKPRLEDAASVYREILK